MKRNFISFLVKIITANNDARCKIVKKKISCVAFGRIFDINAKCPEEEIGRNSVIDCIIAKIIWFNMKLIPIKD